MKDAYGSVACSAFGAGWAGVDAAPGRPGGGSDRDEEPDSRALSSARGVLRGGLPPRPWGGWRLARGASPRAIQGRNDLALLSSPFRAGG